MYLSVPLSLYPRAPFPQFGCFPYFPPGAGAASPLSASRRASVSMEGGSAANNPEMRRLQGGDRAPLIAIKITLSVACN